MSKSKEKFKEFVNEIRNNRETQSHSDFLESLRNITSHSSVEEMIDRFAELADIEKEK